MNTIATIASSIETVLWDLDGTILDSFHIYESSLNKALHEQGISSVPAHILRNHHHGSLEESISGALREMGHILSQSDVALIVKDFYRFDNAFIRNVDEHFFQDAVDLIEQLHKAGKRQLVTTNRAHGIDRGNGSPRNLIANSRVGKAFEAVLCADDSNFRKPDRGFLESQFGNSLSSLGNCLVIGDQHIDAEFAQNIAGSAILVARDGSIAHPEILETWGDHVTVVPSLDAIHV